MLYFLFGILPEVLFFLFFIKTAKDLKLDKKLLSVFVFMLSAYLVLKTIFQYSIYFHLLYILSSMLFLKFVYGLKFKITDVFLFSFASILLVILSAVAYFCIPNFAIALIVNRLLMILTIFIFKNKIRKLYLKFNSVWNRNREKPNKIRSLTVRNISIICFNLMIFIIDFLLHATQGMR